MAIAPLVETRGVGRCLGVGPDLGVGVILGVALGIPVAVAVGVGEGVAVGLGVELGVAVTVGVAVMVGVGVGDGVSVAVGVGVPLLCTSNAPTSIRPFTTRSKPGPRWSNRGGGVKLGLPALVAGLPGKSACVKVGPPLFCSGPSIGLVKSWSPGPVKKPAASSLLILYPSDVTVPPPLT